MKSIIELKNPDIIEINNEKYQVLKHTTHWYHTDKHALEMIIELVKLGSKSISATHCLCYFREKPQEISFFICANKKKESKEIPISSITL